MSDMALTIWVIVVLVILLNGCAAGVVAILHVRGSKMRRGSRVATATAVTGFLPASMFIPFAISDVALTGSEEPLVIAIALVMSFGLAMVLSLPGALVMSRKLEAPGEEYRTFE